MCLGWYSLARGLGVTDVESERQYGGGDSNEIATLYAGVWASEVDFSGLRAQTGAIFKNPWSRRLQGRTHGRHSGRTRN